jgi:hypothetical protein
MSYKQVGNRSLAQINHDNAHQYKRVLDVNPADIIEQYQRSGTRFSKTNAGSLPVSALVTLIAEQEGVDRNTVKEWYTAWENRHNSKVSARNEFIEKWWNKQSEENRKAFIASGLPQTMEGVKKFR